MKKLIRLFPVSLIIGLGLLLAYHFTPVLAQGPQPGSLDPGTQSLDKIETLTMPPVDREKLLREDEQAAPDLPPRFAQPIPVQVTPQTNGTWENLGQGRQMWRLRIVSPGAVSLNFGFTGYVMPSGGQLFIYTPDYKTVIGPFTDSDNEAHGQLWTPLLPGDDVIIEVTLPEVAVPQLELRLTSVNHGYREFGRSPPDKSGSCNVDVVCSAADGFPQVDPWRADIRSVGVYSLGGARICTGALVNNTAQDRKPYFLTANHCGVNAGNAASLVVYWNFENSICRAPDSPASGAPGNGSLSQFQTGAFFRANYAPSDVTLVELDEPTSQTLNVHFAGWDRTGSDATSAVAIHHPNVDEKRISFENDMTSITSYFGTTVPGNSTHIRITDWDLGTTEPGSSGSPLFNQSQRIIGQLHGGAAACGNNSSDWYGRFAVSWTGGGTNATRLSNWLDPANTGTTILDGIDDQPDFQLTATPATQTICAPADAVYNLTISSTSGYSDPVTLSASGQPTGTSANFSVNPVTPAGASVLTLGNTGPATPGGYNLQITGVAPTSTHTTTVRLNLFNSTPGTLALLSPANGASLVPLQPTLSWTAPTQPLSYTLQIATDAAFSNVVYTASMTGTSHVVAAPLSSDTVYYWRVRPDNVCGLGGYSSAFSFTTLALPGECPSGTFSNTLFSEDFEAGSAGWAQGPGGSGNTWALWNTRVHNGTQAWHANAPGSVSDQRLVSPPLTLPTGQSPLSLQFWNYQLLEDRPGGCFDGGLLEISTDNGNNWSQLPNASLLTDPYNGPINSFTNPLNNLNTWCGAPQDWLKSIVDLDTYAGQTVNFRFRVGTDNSVGREGWTIDEVKAQSCQAPDSKSIYLPVIMKDIVFVPNLVVDSLVAANNTITVTIKNIGNAPSTDAFWVDVYLNPSPVPTRVNQTWPQLSSHGLVWGVLSSIPVSGTLILTVGDTYYSTQHSNFSGPVPPGISIWAQVDSVNLNTTYGGVLESHEINGEAYDNIAGPISPTNIADIVVRLNKSTLPTVINSQLPSRE